ncbi:protein of unknown function, might related with Translation elongation factor G [Shewanella benthica]|uniref:Tr-type G domain-containing protein n=1 Tax=Shewanella benthica TaxID=43661 RepID=A0A330LZP0_9GAMM|nr:GTP-binding protein [Shewanella benthica]SQH75869.1 protein of unknown function, might related with Translation elongation factor G [Shewanella benthica]
MAEFITEQIRNLAVLGHTGVGKSTLIEALLYRAKAISQKGRVDRGTNAIGEQKIEVSVEAPLASVDSLVYLLS